MTYKKDMIRLITRLGQRYGNYDVFFDFVELATVALANKHESNKKVFDSREKRYFEIIKRYEKKETEVFPELIGALAFALTMHPDDYLGEIFHELELQNKWKGQYFTPIDICEFMAAIIVGDNVEKIIEKQGYFSVCEPACGSGAMLIGMVRCLERQKVDYQSHMYVQATDIDIRCVHMAHVQLSLLGIAADVIHGNTITMETFSVWETPLMMLIRKNNKGGKQSA